MHVLLSARSVVSRQGRSSNRAAATLLFHSFVPGALSGSVQKAHQGRMDVAVNAAVAQGVERALAERTCRFLERKRALGAGDWAQLALQTGRLVELINDTVADNTKLLDSDSDAASDDEEVVILSASEDDEPAPKRPREEAGPPSAAPVGSEAPPPAAAASGGIDFRALARRRLNSTPVAPTERTHAARPHCDDRTRAFPPAVPRRWSARRARGRGRAPVRGRASRRPPEPQPLRPQPRPRRPRPPPAKRSGTYPQPSPFTCLISRPAAPNRPPSPNRPPRALQLPPPEAFKVLTFNVWFEPWDFRARMDAIGSIITDADPDFVCLQARLQRASRRTFASFLRQLLCANDPARRLPREHGLRRHRARPPRGPQEVTADSWNVFRRAPWFSRYECSGPPYKRAPSPRPKAPGPPLGAPAPERAAPGRAPAPLLLTAAALDALPPTHPPLPTTQRG